MNDQGVIDALALQNQRFNDLMRQIDGGIWWSADAAANLDASAILAQVNHIRFAIDEITRLAKQIAFRPHSMTTDGG